MLSQLKQSRSPEAMEVIIRKLTQETKLQRKFLIYAMHRYSRMSLKEIGQKVGGVSYSGVSRVVERLEQETGENPRIKKLVVRLQQEMSNVKT